MTDFAFAILRMFGILAISGIPGIIAFFGLVALSLYLPSLIITRLLFISDAGRVLSCGVFPTRSAQPFPDEVQTEVRCGAH